MDKEFYVYRWYYKDTNETFHIGKGKGNRYKETKQSRNQYFKNRKVYRLRVMSVTL